MVSNEEHQRIFKMCLAQEKAEFQKALTQMVNIMTY